MIIESIKIKRVTLSFPVNIPLCYIELRFEKVPKNDRLFCSIFFEKKLLHTKSIFKSAPLTDFVIKIAKRLFAALNSDKKLLKVCSGVAFRTYVYIVNS